MEAINFEEDNKVIGSSVIGEKINVSHTEESRFSFQFQVNWGGRLSMAEFEPLCQTTVFTVI